MYSVVSILSFLINIYTFIIIIEVVLSWLIVFEVINVKNPQAQNLIRIIKKLTDPVMQRVRRFIPPIAGLDLTPIIVIFALSLLQKFLWSLV